MSSVVLSLGSNCDSRYVETAISMLAGLLNDFNVSNIYPTPPAAGVGKPYDNAVATGEWAGTMESLNSLLKNYECSAGRDEAAREAGFVLIDIDIVVWDGAVVRPWDFSQSFFRIGYESVMQHSVPTAN
ncbi:MAG: 2-amino-4-hydroxy-6-hydroxymethyldihydropteridine diphosphokinase [Muribaculaceae bacterium]|nr:2-amino-4-hydroxy-6-hydroxymethyldihydropteridine diphosphokinase [Muribaculaceae bacterium]